MAQLLHRISRKTAGFREGWTPERYERFIP
jgi:hypothetical protein